MENIFTSLRPFTTFAKLLGAFPLSFEGRVRNGNLKTKFFDALISIFIIFALSIGFWCRILELDFFTSRILMRLLVYSQTFEFVTLCIKLIYQNVKRKSYRKVLKLLDEFDEKVNKIHKKPHKKSVRLERSKKSDVFIIKTERKFP
jgi:hypothetical protein